MLLYIEVSPSSLLVSKVCSNSVELLHVISGIALILITITRVVLVISCNLSLCPGLGRCCVITILGHKLKAGVIHMSVARMKLSETLITNTDT